MSSATKITKTVSLDVGEQFTLPKGATVISLTGAVSNSCEFDLPDPTPYLAYSFRFAINEDNNDDHPLGGLVNIESLLINGVTVPLTFTQMNTDSSGNSSGINQWNSEISTNNTLVGSYPCIFVNITADYGAGAKSDTVIVNIKMPESYLNKIFLRISSYYFPTGLLIQAS